MVDFAFLRPTALINESATYRYTFIHICAIETFRRVELSIMGKPLGSNRSNHLSTFGVGFPVTAELSDNEFIAFCRRVHLYPQTSSYLSTDELISIHREESIFIRGRVDMYPETSPSPSTEKSPSIRRRV